MITEILRHATIDQLAAAITWTADNLHLPEQHVSGQVAVAYVCKHFEAGQLTGWDGFIENAGL